MAYDHFAKVNQGVNNRNLYLLELTLLDYRGTRILASSVLSRHLNASIQMPPFGYVHKRTRTVRPRLKGFIQFFLFFISTTRALACALWMVKQRGLGEPVLQEGFPP